MKLLLDKTFSVEQLQSLAGDAFEDGAVKAEAVSDDVLEHAFRALRPGTKLVVEAVPTRELGNSLTTDMRIQGFQDIMCAKDSSTGERFVVGTKPAGLSVGATAAIQLPASTAATGSKWTMDSMDLADSDLVDEQALLDDGDIPVSETKLDCGPGGPGGKKRACKNCSCGLAEIEAKEGSDAAAAAAAAVDPVAKASSCGGCYKGDAFRCAGCPYLGKPAFEPGQERLVLALADDI